MVRSAPDSPELILHVPTPVRLGITLGDVNGIGPEVAVRAAMDRRSSPHQLVLIGPEQALRQHAIQHGMDVPPAWKPGDAWPSRTRRVWWSPEPIPRFRAKPGRVCADAAQVAMHLVSEGVRACMDGHLHGLVTAPINKEGLTKAHLEWPGHTEFLAACAGRKRIGMLLAAGTLRVFLLTRHVPLSAVPGMITASLLRSELALLTEALPWLGVSGGRIGVCGLNPHCGDGGAIGHEDDRIVRPALKRLALAGLPVEGPFPADTIFHQAVNGRFAVVAAMYHDQGLAPLKLHGFDRGVNITLGLPFVRTSPDHGTAYDLVGTGLASARSMIEAITTAADLARRANPWRLS